MILGGRRPCSRSTRVASQEPRSARPLSAAGRCTAGAAARLPFQLAEAPVWVPLGPVAVLWRGEASLWRERVSSQSGRRTEQDCPELQTSSDPPEAPAAEACWGWGRGRGRSRGAAGFLGAARPHACRIVWNGLYRQRAPGGQAEGQGLGAEAGQSSCSRAGHVRGWALAGLQGYRLTFLREQQPRPGEMLQVSTLCKPCELAQAAGLAERCLTVRLWGLLARV